MSQLSEQDTSPSHARTRGCSWAPKVVCTSCGTSFDSYDSGLEGGYGCAAIATPTDVTGFYGSTVADMTQHVFAGPRPAWVQDGLMCDTCIVRLRTEGAIVESAGMTMGMGYGLDLVASSNPLPAFIEADATRADGRPVLAGTAFTLSRLIQGLAAGQSLPELARSQGLNLDIAQGALQSLAIRLDQPVAGADEDSDEGD